MYLFTACDCKGFCCYGKFALVSKENYPVNRKIVCEFQLANLEGKKPG
jgi:hypothetical protein